MKMRRWFSAIMLIGLVASSVVGFAQSGSQSDQQEEQKDQAAPPRPQEPQPVPAPTPNPHEIPPAQQPPKPKPEQRPPQAEPQKRSQEDEKKAPEQSKKTQKEQAERGEGQGQPGNAPTASSGKPIPAPQFREHFGREHTFVINRPVIVENRPRFQFSGYWFQIVDPWPADWAYTDECYIDYLDDTYYLFDPMHPGIRLVVIVVG